MFGNGFQILHQHILLIRLLNYKQSFLFMVFILIKPFIDKLKSNIND